MLLRIAAVNEPNICLMYECGRLQGLTGRFASQFFAASFRNSS